MLNPPASFCFTLNFSIPEGFLFVATKRNPSDSKEKNAFGAMVRRGIVVTTRSNIYRLLSLSLYETGVLSFPRDGALRRSAYRVIVRKVRQWHPNLA